MVIKREQNENLIAISDKKDFKFIGSNNDMINLITCMTLLLLDYIDEEDSTYIIRNIRDKVINYLIIHDINNLDTEDIFNYCFKKGKIKYE